MPQRNGAGEPGASASNFIRSIIASDVEAGRTRVVVTRFPPEPNGYLHLAHAKSIVLNYELAKEVGGRCNLRLDDTNPAKERMEYIDAIKRDVQWLGFDWAQGLRFASDYFEQLYAGPSISSTLARHTWTTSASRGGASVHTRRRSLEGQQHG